MRFCVLYLLKEHVVVSVTSTNGTNGTNSTNAVPDA